MRMLRGRHTSTCFNTSQGDGARIVGVFNKPHRYIVRWLAARRATACPTASRKITPPVWGWGGGRGYILTPCDIYPYIPPPVVTSSVHVPHHVIAFPVFTPNYRVCYSPETYHPIHTRTVCYHYCITHISVYVYRAIRSLTRAIGTRYKAAKKRLHSGLN